MSEELEYRLPFAGRWFVTSAGDTVNVNHHMRTRPQWYGMDFMKAGEPNGRGIRKTRGKTVEDYYGWNEAVLAPVAGEVVAIMDGLPDNRIGYKDEKRPAGNHVIIKAAADRFVFVAHFKNGSVKVRAGQKVAAGQELGRCGNSGNSDCPHIHLHVQDGPTLNEGQGQNVIFKRINVELTGKQFEGVDWPLIRGLFVENGAV